MTPAERVAREGFTGECPVLSMILGLTFVVGEDLVRYMDNVGGNTSFLVKDPVWAIDFAPNGTWSFWLTTSERYLTASAGTLLGLGDVITRKRYAE